MPERNPSGYPQNSLSWKYSEEGESSSRSPATDAAKVTDGILQASNDI